MTTVASAPPSRASRAFPSGVREPSAGASALRRRYRPLCSKKSTGSGSSIADRSSPYASSTVAGQTTLRPGCPTNQPSGEPAWKGPPRTPPPVGQRITIGIAWPERQCVLAATVTIMSNGQATKSANCSSTTGRSPIHAAPIAAPTKPSSEIGRVEDPLRPELVEQPGGGAERAAEVADVLAEQEDAIVLAQRVGEGGSNRLEVRDLGDASDSTVRRRAAGATSRRRRPASSSRRSSGARRGPPAPAPSRRRSARRRARSPPAPASRGSAARRCRC